MYIRTITNLEGQGFAALPSNRDQGNSSRFSSIAVLKKKKKLVLLKLIFNWNEEPIIAGMNNWR